MRSARLKLIKQRSDGGIRRQFQVFDRFRNQVFEDAKEKNAHMHTHRIPMV